MTTTSTTTRRKAPSKPAKPRPADVCRLTATIRGTVYGVRPTPCATGRAWRLVNRATGQVYDVAEGEFGPECDCPDATYRHDGSDGTSCKHVRALGAMNLIALTVESDPAGWPSWCDRVAFRTR